VDGGGEVGREGSKRKGDAITTKKKKKEENRWEAHSASNAFSLGKNSVRSGLLIYDLGVPRMEPT